MHWPFKERGRLSAPVDTPLGSLPQRGEIRAPSSSPSPQSAATGLSQLDALSTPRGLRAQFESLHCCGETKEDEGPDLAKPNQNRGSGLEYSATPLCLAWARPTTFECGWRTPNSHDGLPSNRSLRPTLHQNLLPHILRDAGVSPLGPKLEPG